MLAAALLWSTSGVFARAPIFDAWPEVEKGPLLGFWRAVFAAAVLLPMIRRPRLRWGLAPLGISFAAMNVTYLTAVILTTPANAIWLQSASPWWIFLFTVVVLRQPADRRDLVPLAFGGLGVATILVFEWSHPASMNIAGVSCGIAAGMSYAAVVFLMGRLRDENPAWLVAWTHALAALTLLPWVVWLGRWPTPEQLLVLAAFGTLQMGLPYIFLLRALHSIRPQEAVIIGLVEPVLMPLWVLLVWDVKADWWTILGAALILTGLVLRYGVMELAGQTWRRAKPSRSRA